MIITGLILGALLGAILQRGRFCVTGMLRDIYTRRSFRGFTALLIVIAVQAVGVAVLSQVGVISPGYDPFAPIAVIVGSVLFGIGIVAAGGCASGTWYRAGEGLVGSWLALATYALSAAAMKTGPLLGLNTWLRSFQLEATTIPASLGISSWWFVLGLVALTAWSVWYFISQDKNLAAIPTLSIPRHKKPIHIYVAGFLVGIVGIVAWPLSAATGRNDGLGITTPSKNVANFIVTGDPKFIDWGALLVLGILLGATVAAKYAGELRVRVPDGKTSTRSLFGGVLMGVGASWAGGCTVGNGMVQTSLFTYQGWLALFFTAVGVFIAAKLWLKPAGTSARSVTPRETYTLEQAIDDDIDLIDEQAQRAANQNDTAEKTPFDTAQPAAAYARDNDGFDLDGIGVAPGAVALKTRPPQLQTHGLKEIATDTYVLDTLGAVCPFPLIEAQAAFDRLRGGQTLVIDFDCTQATEAIPRWAAENGYEVTRFVQTDDAGWQIAVRKPLG